jgi:hypothetical protein
MTMKKNQRMTRGRMQGTENYNWKKRLRMHETENQNGRKILRMTNGRMQGAEK